MTKNELRSPRLNFGWNTFSGCHKNRAFSEATSVEEKILTVPFRSCWTQILWISNCIKLYYQITVEKKKFSQFDHVERWYLMNRNEAHKSCWKISHFPCFVLKKWKNGELAMHPTKVGYSTYQMSSYCPECAIMQRDKRIISFAQKISWPPGMLLYMENSKVDLQFERCRLHKRQEYWHLATCQMLCWVWKTGFNVWKA